MPEYWVLSMDRLEAKNVVLKDKVSQEQIRFAVSPNSVDSLLLLVLKKTLTRQIARENG